MVTILIEKTTWFHSFILKHGYDAI